MNKGIYCLLFRNKSCNLEIGKINKRDFAAGWHIYVGSALGPGGIKRVDRHRRYAMKQTRRHRWHVDYLLSSDAFVLVKAFCAFTEEQLECNLARLLGGENVAGFGCSDCQCPSHLLYRPDDPSQEIRVAFQILGLFCNEQNYEINEKQA